MAASPRLLLFDLDGVLAAYSREARAQHLARAIGVDADEVHAALFGPAGLELRSDRGEINLPDYLQQLRERHGWRLEQDDFLAARRHATRMDPVMLGLCDALAPQAALAVFTNNGGWVAEFAQQIVPELAPLFGDRLVCSGQLGMVKPQPESYRACLHRLGASAETTLFFDDRAENVEGARVAGLDAVLHSDVASLRAALIERGLNPGANHAT